MENLKTIDAVLTEKAKKLAQSQRYKLRDAFGAMVGMIPVQRTKILAYLIWNYSRDMLDKLRKLENGDIPDWGDVDDLLLPTHKERIVDAFFNELKTIKAEVGNKADKDHGHGGKKKAKEDAPKADAGDDLPF